MLRLGRRLGRRFWDVIMERRALVTCAVLALVAIATTSPAERQGRFTRINIPFLGLGHQCRGCPPHFCDDDPAIVLGYCCGCAGWLDNLPVRCPPGVETRCPLNNYELCDDYEYMMHCCCA